jgi:hypothetical protein
MENRSLNPRPGGTQRYILKNKFNCLILCSEIRNINSLIYDSETVTVIIIRRPLRDVNEATVDSFVSVHLEKT